MKFTDGNWMIRQGYNVIPAIQAHDFELQKENVTAYAVPRQILNRSGMLDSPMITVHLHSPQPGVIGVKITHHAGVVDRGPHFELNVAHGHATVEENDHEVILTTGNLSAIVRKGPDAWSLDFVRDGERITGSRFKSIAYITGPDQTRYIREELDLGVGEYVYGLGERFTAFVKNGQSVDIWNKDGGTSSEQSYKNIPFYLTNKGYGVFVNDPGAVSFEIASEKVKRVQFSVPGESMEYFIIDGPAPKDVLEKYTLLTGRPALPPAWTFGLWLSTSFTTNYDEATVNSFVDGMAERDLPLHVFHFDCFWMQDFHWTDFKWDERIFPDPAGMLARLKEKGLKICVWINPYISQRSRLFKEGMENGYLLKKANGDVWQWDMWQPGMGIVDFTNPAASEWYAGYLRELVDMGVDSFKTDFGERIPTDVVYHNGANSEGMHNYYTYLYNEVVFNVLREKLGEGEAAVFARSATVGGQKFPVHWGGDCDSDYESMAESLRGGLSLGLSGYGFWSHDIGGFENKSPAHVFKRWVAFGLLSSHSRLHGSTSYRVPWEYDEEAVDVTRFFTKLKARLMPYLFDTAAQAAERGTPSMRAMLLEFPDDPASELLDRQYMLGQSLLVAPVFSEKGEVKYYLPQGTWTHLLTGETVEGGSWYKETYGFSSLPLFARPNSIIAMGQNDKRPDYDYTDGTQFNVYALEDGRSVQAIVRSSVDGKEAQRVTASRAGNVITVKSEGSDKPFSVALHSSGTVATAEGTGVSADGNTVHIPGGTAFVEFTITLG